MQQHDRVSFTVVLEGLPVVVEGPAVELDDELGLLEVRVYLVAVQDDVDLRRWEVVVAAEREEVVFET
jgi:hypothetical protein